MNYLMRILRLLGIVTWVGGLIFFAFVEAQTAFHVMGTTRQFAEIINGSVTALNHIGYVAGFIFLFATLVLWWRIVGHSHRLFAAEFLLIACMLAATFYVQHSIIPAMERDRAAAGGDVATLALTNPTRANFDRLHDLSEKVEGSALFLGFGVILLMAAEPSFPPLSR